MTLHPLFALLFLGSLFSSGEDQKPAEESLTFKVDQVPDWKARLELSEILAQQKKYDEAEKEVQKVLKEKPDSTDAKLTLAEILTRKGNEAAAQKILQGIQVASLTEKQMLKRASIESLQENFEEAEEIYAKLLQKNPKNDLARLKLAETFSWDKKYDQSLLEFERLLKVYPEDTNLRRKYAFVLNWMGEKDLAAEELRKTLRD